MARITPLAGLYRRTLVVALLLCGLAGCAPPMSVERIDLRDAYNERNRSALSGDGLSEATRIVLRRGALADDLDTAPDQTIAALRAQAIARGMPWRDLFALSELNYLRARQTRSRDHFLAAALYAYAVLFPDGTADRPSAYDAQFRQACDLYNMALTQVLAIDGGAAAQLRAGRYELPFGTLDIAIDPAGMRTGGRQLDDFVPTLDLRVRGFQNVFRTDGIGAPLAASLNGTQGASPTQADGVEFPKILRIPTSAVLQLPDPRRQLAGTSLRATLSVHAIFEAMSIRIGMRDVPLEFEQSAVRALSLTEGRGWTTEIAGLFGDGRLDTHATSRLFAIEPHRRGRMPVVLVHGTASSPFRWADMVNDLLEEPRIRDHFEFWVFRYSTGNPVPVSALLLRQSLERAVQALGGTQSDPALGRMVVIGHSQGGLLAKMLAIDSGSRLWDGISNRQLDAMALSPETRTLLRDALFVRPLPTLEAVIFIATPHRGSFLAAFSLARLVQSFISLPLTIVSLGAELVSQGPDAWRTASGGLRLNSLAGMSPDNPLLRTLAEIPVAPPIRAYSIIPTRGDGPLEERDDGVVEFRSAHIEGVESELVVPSGHSTQANPLTIAEVRRILLLQLERKFPDATVRVVGDGPRR